ncbi:MAG: glycosyltransferase family 2 protein [Prevotellaceae bacterium]|nr:glycosyltransferase family 2 protein [Prevotellaceae bacterium]
MISVVINTYNAEKHLIDVLEAAKDFDEIVICDMESNDNTIEIAKKYSCKIITFPKQNHKSAEPARTYAIQNATSKWVLVVDADEIITTGLRQYLYERIKDVNCPAGLYIARRNKVFGKYSRDWSRDYQLRFFVRKGTTWPPYVHTFPQIQGIVEYAPACYQLLHLADVTTAQWISKMNEYTDNEIVKKANRNFGIAALFLRPLWRFVLSYFIRGGFCNGRRGLLQAIQWAIYQQVLVSKIIEHKCRESV